MTRLRKMKKHNWIALIMMLVGITHAQPEDETRTVTLIPSLNPNDREDEWEFTLAPNQTAIYNVNIEREGWVGEVLYELEEPLDPPVFNPAYNNPNFLWAWEQTGGSATARSRQFKVVNTVWEDKTAVVTVTCRWLPVSVPGDGEGEAPGPLDGEAVGIAKHQWGDIVTSSDIDVDGAPDYLCIHETVTLSSWLVTDEFPHQNYELIEADWSVEGLTPSYGGGEIDPTHGDTVLFTPTNTGLVKVTATTEIGYNVHSGDVEFTIIEVKIGADPEPGNLICTGGTREYTAAVTPGDVAGLGTFTWRVNNGDKLGFVNNENTGQTVTVTGKQDSASMNAEELTVEFRVNNELICEPSTNLTVVKVEFIENAETCYSFSPSLGEEANLKVQISPEINLPGDEYLFEIEIVRKLQSGNDQQIAFVAMDEGGGSERNVDFGSETFSWDGIAGPYADRPISNGPDEFEGVSDDFNRGLPAVTASQPVPPPLYTAVARIREYGSIGLPNGPILCEAEQTIYVPQVVKLKYDADAEQLLRSALHHPAETNVVIYEEMETGEQWDAFKDNHRQNVQAAFDIDGGVNIRIVGPDAEITGANYSTITVEADYAVTNGIPATNILGRAQADFRNRYPSRSGWLYVPAHRWAKQQIAVNIFIGAPLTIGEITAAYSTVTLHELGHTLGLVHDALGGEGWHNPTPMESRKYMNSGAEYQERIGLPFSWREHNYDYLKFVLPKQD